MTGSNEPILVNVEKRTAYITLNRPDVLNAINYEMMRQLEEAVKNVSARKDVSVIVIKGAGRAFCAGADLSFVLDTIKKPDDLENYSDQINRAFNSLEDTPLPVVAVVQDLALAGGFEMIQACDIVLAAEKARLGDQHANFWLIPGGGGSQRLPYSVGLHRSKDILFTGRWLSGREAEQMGLVSRAVPAETLESTLQEVVDSLIQKSPATIKAMKTLINSIYKQEIRRGLEFEKAVFLSYIQGSSAQEGLTAFREKRKPQLDKIGL